MKVVHKLVRPARVNLHKRRAVKNVLQASYLIKRHYETILIRYNINLQKLLVLQVLYEEFPEALTQKQIRPRVPDHSLDLARIIRQMEELDLIRHLRNKNKRPIPKIEITSKGIEVLKEIEKCENEINSALAYVTDEESKQIAEIMQKIAIRLTEVSMQCFLKIGNDSLTSECHN